MFYLFNQIVVTPICLLLKENLQLLSIFVIILKKLLALKWFGGGGNISFWGRNISFWGGTYPGPPSDKTL